MTRSTSFETSSGRPSSTRDLEVDAEPLGVLAGDFGRLRREVGGGDPQVGALGEQGQGDRAGAGADLVHAGALGQLGADLDQQLGLAARPEHPLVDGDLEPAEGRAAEDVGQRLVVGAARDPLPRSPPRPRPATSPALSPESSSASIPSASATSASASARGSSQPAAAIAPRPSSTASPTVAADPSSL